MMRPPVTEYMHVCICVCVCACVMCARPCPANGGAPAEQPSAGTVRGLQGSASRLHGLARVLRPGCRWMEKKAPDEPFRLWSGRLRRADSGLSFLCRYFFYSLLVAGFLHIASFFLSAVSAGFAAASTLLLFALPEHLEAEAFCAATKGWDAGSATEPDCALSFAAAQEKAEGLERDLP